MKHAVHNEPQCVPVTLISEFDAYGLAVLADKTEYNKETELHLHVRYTAAAVLHREQR